MTSQTNKAVVACNKHGASAFVI